MTEIIQQLIEAVRVFSAKIEHFLLFSRNSSCDQTCSTSKVHHKTTPLI